MVLPLFRPKERERDCFGGVFLLLALCVGVRNFEICVSLSLFVLQAAFCVSLSLSLYLFLSLSGARSSRCAQSSTFASQTRCSEIIMQVVFYACLSFAVTG